MNPYPGYDFDDAKGGEMVWIVILDICKQIFHILHLHLYVNEKGVYVSG